MWRILIVLAVCVVVGWMENSKADYIDLDDADVLQPPIRCDTDKPLVCFLVEKDEKIYIVVHDQKGELLILEVQGKELILIWGRELI